MRHRSNSIPHFGDFADPRNVATVATAAEQAGWDGLFVWDHVLHRQHQGRPFGDPWMLLTAAALATSRIRLGTLLTPVPRYRPRQLARQLATLDHLSGGRVIFAAGLGGPIEDEYRSFGDAAEPHLLAERLDDGLELLRRFWSGEPVNHHGQHVEVQDVTLLPATVQRPGPPLWIGGPGRVVRLCGGQRGGTARCRCSRRPGMGMCLMWRRYGILSAMCASAEWPGRNAPSSSCSAVPLQQPTR